MCVMRLLIKISTVVATATQFCVWILYLNVRFCWSILITSVHAQLGHSEIFKYSTLSELPCLAWEGETPPLRPLSRRATTVPPPKFEVLPAPMWFRNIATVIRSLLQANASLVPQAHFLVLRTGVKSLVTLVKQLSKISGLTSVELTHLISLARNA